MSLFVLSPERSVASTIEYEKELNQEQLDVVFHGNGPCLVLAGAGSGKTRTLVYRVAYLLEQGVDPSTILLLTFTNKAARSMTDRVADLMKGGAHTLWSGTFHSIASRFLRMYASELGYTSGFSIMDAEDARDLLKTLLKERGIDSKNKQFPSVSVVQDVISYARNAQKPIPAVLLMKHPHLSEAGEEVEELAMVYQTRKKSGNMMDFDDLLSLLAFLLEHPLHGASLASRFRFVLVDEYQDTNTLQARIVKGFADRHQQVLVVGDDAQSIYAFRAADVQNILAFPKEWKDAKTFKLLTNYRSTPEILALANESLTHNEDQFEKELVAVGEHGSKPKLVPCQSASQEARYIADQIGLLRGKGLRLEDMAVLFRSSGHSQALEFELMKRDIPYEYRGGQKFFERAHIKDAICFLRIRHNSKDEVAWLRILQLQNGIGSTGARAFAKRMTQTSRWEDALTDAHVWRGKAREGWQELAGLLKELGASSEEPSVVLRRIAASSYKRTLEQAYPNWRERLDDLEQIALFAESYRDTASFLADVALYDGVVAEQQGGESAFSDRVVLSTIHQAKGLEWQAVFVMRLADQSFPSRRALAEEGGMEEERRLFYVAMTRARREVFLTYPMTLGHEMVQFQQPSTFLEEVSSHLFDHVEIRDPFAVRGFLPKRPYHDEGWMDDEPTIDDTTR